MTNDTPPVAEKVPNLVTVHGDTRVDEYSWLREKDNPKAMAYLRAEDRYADAVMRPTAALQETLYEEMVGHIQETDSSAPARRGDYLYYTRTEKAKQYPILCRRRVETDAPEEITLDVNQLAEGQAFMSVGAYEVSDDGELLAYTTDNRGYREYTLHVKDLRSGILMPLRVERVNGVAWAADNRTLFYVTEDAVTKRVNRLYRQTLDDSAGTLVFEEHDELFDLGVGRTRDRVFILMQSASKTATEIQYLRAATPAASLKMIAPRRPEHEYDAEHGGDVFYIRTNKDAINFRVMRAPDENPGEEHWTELIAHRSEVKIAGFEPFARHLVLVEWEEGLQQIEVVELATKTRKRIEFPEPVYAAYVGANLEFDTTTLRYHYQSPTTPDSTFDYDMDTQAATLLKQTEVPGGFNRAHYAAERVFATATDGTRIPISLVHRVGAPRNRTAPLLLYAYGSYGVSVPPAFSVPRLALLDRGVTYAIAHVRGGGELGEPWREAGRMARKMTTFTDFIAAAEHLERGGYTSQDRLAIQGASAGGMLVGAVVNMRPELFRAAIAQVPFVDVLNTMLDPTLPLTTGEYIEWGDPNEKAAYETLKQYSPYDNVRAQAYPAMLVKVSLNDSQVPYWEGAKWVAKLRAVQTGTAPLLLKVNFGAGHGGASGRYDRLREIAFDWAFVLSEIGRAQSV